MNNSTTHNTSTSNFPIAISLLSLMAITLLVLISYYIFVIKSCGFNYHTLRRFSFPRNTRDFNLSTIIPTTTNDTFLYENRGLDEWHINNIPTFQYKQTKCIRITSSLSYGGCRVCLNEFHDQEMLRLLPRCSHIFHLDCIDIWLLNNATCPLCRSSISGRTKYPIDHIIAPSSSPISSYDPDFVILEIEPNNAQITEVCNNHKCSDRIIKNGRKEKRFSTMGDEGIHVNRVKDEQFCVEKTIRRSFSMDSIVDCGVYLQIQEMIMMQNRVVNDNCHVNGGVNDNYHSFNEEGQSNNQRFRRGTFFSFGHSCGSSRSSSILPLEIDG